MAEVTEAEIQKVTDQLSELRSNLQELTKELSRNNKAAADNIISSVKEQVEDIENLKKRADRMQKEFGEQAKKTANEAKSIELRMNADADALRRAERMIELDRKEALLELQKEKKKNFKQETEDIDKLLKQQV
ncbi:MAG: hypothetical protein CL554_21005, partial [Algoriphagus sp.]|uniref:hypothetical protein n=1 Tax=Algoriphagus sp. TaxID=1872435 RepID=UPI000C5FA130